MTLWTLDSCGDPTTENCQVEVDDNFNFVRFVSRCPAHQNIPDNITGFNQIRQENSRGKGNVEWEILQNAPAGMFDVNADGTRTFKQGITATWNWTGSAPDRVLNIHVTGITPTQNQINAIRNKLDTRFGLTNVVLTFG